MRRVFALSFPLIFLASFPAAALADSVESLVIPGIHPSAYGMRPSVAPSPPVARANSALGGGFLEFLVTGSPRPAHAVAYAPAPVQPIAVAPMQQQMAALAPATLDALKGEPSEIYQRQDVAYNGAERPGTIIIDTPNKFLFLVRPNGRALRYGIGVGRPGFEWSGVKHISRKAEWPDWTPPPEMLLRRPDLPLHMAGGPENPLGARALYLGSSMYRIHGTNEPSTIGQNLSSGCIRMMNEDVIDLYERVKVGTQVTVL